MNKAQLVDALTARLGDRRAAADAVDAMVEVIVDTVGSGGSVTLTGFGVFEPRRRAPRTARNPRTGDTVPVEETVVPSFRPGAAFKERVADSDAAAAGATSAPRRAPRERATAESDGSASAEAGAGSGRTARRSAGSRTAGAAKTADAAETTGSKDGRTTATKKSVPPDTDAAEPPAKKKSSSRKKATAAEK